MPAPSKTATTRKSTATPVSGPRPKPGSGSASPRLSTKARELAKELKDTRRKLRDEQGNRQSAEWLRDIAVKEKQEAERDLRKIADGYVQIDPMARRRRFVMEIDEYAAARSFHSHDIYAMALKKLIQAMTDHHMANSRGIAEGMERELSTKLQRRAVAKTLMHALGLTDVSEMQHCHSTIGALMNAMAEPFYSKHVLQRLVELLRTGIDVVFEEHHAKKQSAMMPA